MTDPAPESEPKRHCVCICFTASQKRRLCRSEPMCCGDGGPRWTDRPLLLERLDGRLQLIGTTADLDGLARWILSFAGDAEVESPPALRRRVHAAAHQITTLYDLNYHTSEERPPYPRQATAPIH